MIADELILNPGRTIQQWRWDHNISQDVLHLAIGYSKPYISHVETGRLRPSYGLLKAFYLVHRYPAIVREYQESTYDELIYRGLMEA